MSYGKFLNILLSGHSDKFSLELPLKIYSSGKLKLLLLNSLFLVTKAFSYVTKIDF